MQHSAAYFALKAVTISLSRIFVTFKQLFSMQRVSYFGHDASFAQEFIALFFFQINFVYLFMINFAFVFFSIRLLLVSLMEVSSLLLAFTCTNHSSSNC